MLFNSDGCVKPDKSAHFSEEIESKPKEKREKTTHSESKKCVEEVDSLKERMSHLKTSEFHESKKFLHRVTSVPFSKPSHLPSFHSETFSGKQSNSSHEEESHSESSSSKKNKNSKEGGKIKKGRRFSNFLLSDSKKIYPLHDSLESIGAVPPLVVACIKRLNQLQVEVYKGTVGKQLMKYDVEETLHAFEAEGERSIFELEKADLILEILKRYLKAYLPDSIIPHELQEKMIDCVDPENCVNFHKLQFYIAKIPRFNRETLAYIIHFLEGVAWKKEGKAPHPKEPSEFNLAEYFQPLLFKSALHLLPKDTTAKKTELCTILMNEMIGNYQFLFEQKPIFSLEKIPSFSTLPLNSAGNCPQIIEDCMDRLMHLQAYTWQGIGRLAPSEHEVHFIQQLAECGNRYAILSCDSPHLIVALLKRILRAADSKVICNDLQDSFLSLEEGDLKNYHLFLKHLPGLNREILKRLLHFFHLVSIHEKTTLMTAANCAVCISQNLVNIGIGDLDNLPPAKKIALISSLQFDASRANNVVEHLIVHYYKLFAEH